MSKTVDTEVRIDTTWKHTMFEIHEVDDIGSKTGVYPVVKFGIKKAKAIVKHLDELKKFIEEQEK